MDPSSSHTGLPNEEGTLEILFIHTAQMRENKMLSDDVDLSSLARVIQNLGLGGTEIEGLVRSAQSTAMYRIIKVQNLLLPW